MKWYTTLEIVDIETGEIIPKWKIEYEEYIITKKEMIKTIIENNYGNKKIRWECKRNPQRRIEF